MFSQMLDRSVNQVSVISIGVVRKIIQNKKLDVRVFFVLFHKPSDCSRTCETQQVFHTHTKRQKHTQKHQVHSQAACGEK